MHFLRLLLYPVSLLYGFIMFFRNLLFDLRILPSLEFSFPIIGIGNLSCGGTGKTPHTEYLIRLLSPPYFIGILSRGYGRNTKGFLLVSKHSQAKSVGDEPLQYASKFENIKVAVDEKRKHGIQTLMQHYPNLDLLILDDVFQHRYVKPGLSILLTDYHHLYTEDQMLPTGMLREFRCGAKRADLIVVTKTPKIFSPITRRRIIEDLHLGKHQRVLFSYLKYGDPIPVFDPRLLYPQKTKVILLITGIAYDDPLREHLQRYCSELIVMKFPDHYQFEEKDVALMNSRYQDILSKQKVIITTEKDVMRLKTPLLSNFFKDLPLFYLTVEVEFHKEDKNVFNHYIINYVEQNQRNHSLS